MLLWLLGTPMCTVTMMSPWYDKPKAHAYGMALSHSFGVGHGSLGASPLDPLVHIFNPSPYAYVKSQLQCSISLNSFFFFSNSTNKNYR